MSRTRRAGIANGPALSRLVALALVVAVLAACGRSEPAPVTYGNKPTTSGAYVVQRGDTVYGLARRFDVPIRAVIEENDLRPPYTLYVGQRLRIPPPRVHSVRRGETVYGISRRYGVPMSELVRANRLRSPYTIQVGQLLVIPGGARSATGQAPAPSLAEAPGEGPAPPPAKPTPPPPASEGADQPEETQALAQDDAPRRDAEPLPAPPPRSGGRFAWPVSGPILLGFGQQEGGLHNDGINIAAPRGEAVRAAENGVVAYIGDELRGFGNLILLKHDGGWITAYAHTDAVLVERGQRVMRGEVIARVGKSGNVDRPQLHFELRKGRDPIDPLSQLPRRTAGAAD